MAPALVPSRVREVIESRPAHVCMVDGERRTTYRELGAMISAAASSFAGRLAPGERVAIFADNSAELAAAIYGAWKAGCVAVALNAALRAPDLARLVQHSEATLVVGDPSQAEWPALRKALGDSVPVSDIDAVVRPEASEGEPALPSPSPAARASIIYTSGTTGHPKGVVLTHRNIAANTASISEYLGIRPDDRMLCVLPFYYSYGASVLHTHLVSGATLILERSLAYPHVVLDRIVAERATSFAGVPSTFYILLRRADLKGHDLTSLRYVTQAGGGMQYEKIREFRDAVPGVDFVVMYGQTEATARLAYVPPDELDRKRGSAGKAIPGVRISIQDDAGRPLPSGELGEVCAQGDNVMLEYWRDPEETAAVLRDGWLHTGDLGYMDEDGYLFLSGRAREMIKSGAHRISAAEIEEVIRSVEGVDDVAVLGSPDEILGQAVKAVVISTTPTDDLAREIKRVCRDRLPLFKVPKIVEFRDEFPRTGSGKIQKHLL